MPVSKKQSEVSTIGTAEALYRLYLELPKTDRLKVARYILEDAEIEIPNDTTLKSFGENKSSMPEFHSVEALRKDLLS
jgi:hypothetical protein